MFYTEHYLDQDYDAKKQGEDDLRYIYLRHFQRWFYPLIIGAFICSPVDFIIKKITKKHRKKYFEGLNSACNDKDENEADNETETKIGKVM